MLLAADSQYSDFNHRRMVADAKVQNLFDTVAFGYCGSGRLGQILTYQMRELDEPPLGLDEHEWTVRYFIETLRSVLDSMGHLHNDSIGDSAGVEHMGGSAFLLAVRGRLFGVMEDFEALEHQLTFDAVGSGTEVAYGAMEALLSQRERTKTMTDAKAELVASAGLKAAAEHTNYVGGKVVSVSTVCWTPEEKALARKILKRR